MMEIISNNLISIKDENVDLRIKNRQNQDTVDGIIIIHIH